MNKKSDSKYLTLNNLKGWEGLIDSSQDIVACISTWLLSEEK